MLPFSSPEAPESPLRTLTTDLARGDDAAWMRFHCEYGPSLFRQLLAATHGDHDLASEALQQAYLRIARHVRPCDADGQFAAWLRLVTRSALSDCRRRRRGFFDLLRRRAIEPVEEADDANDGQLALALEASLVALAPEQRALLEAKYYRRESVQHIAEHLGVSVKAVESRLTRARAELRERLQTTLTNHSAHD